MNLRDYRRTDELTSAQAWKCLQDVAAALHYLHQRSIVHRDVKQENCIVCREPRNDEKSRNDLILIKVSDFGLARVLPSDPAPCIMTPGVGTRGFRAPEMV